MACSHSWLPALSPKHSLAISVKLRTQSSERNCTCDAIAEHAGGMFAHRFSPLRYLLWFFTDVLGSNGAVLLVQACRPLRSPHGMDNDNNDNNWNGQQLGMCTVCVFYFGILYRSVTPSSWMHLGSWMAWLAIKWAGVRRALYGPNAAFFRHQ